MDNSVATVTADLGAGDCLLDCGPLLQRCLGRLDMKILSPFSVLLLTTVV